MRINAHESRVAAEDGAQRHPGKTHDFARGISSLRERHAVERAVMAIVADELNGMTHGSAVERRAQRCMLGIAEVVSTLQGMRANIHHCRQEYEDLQGDGDALSSFGFSLRMNNLKIASSKVVVDVVTQAMLICGISGYKNDSPYSLSRHLRDAYGAALMINNDRILGANASMLLVHKED